MLTLAKMVPHATFLHTGSTLQFWMICIFICSTKNQLSRSTEAKVTFPCQDSIAILFSEEETYAQNMCLCGTEHLS